MKENRIRLGTTEYFMSISVITFLMAMAFALGKIATLLESIVEIMQSM